MQITYMKQNSHGLLTVPRSLTSPHLEHNAPDTPNINFGVVSFLCRVDDLWRHPEHGALHRCIRPGHIDVLSPLGDTEIRYLADSGRFHEDVIGLQVLPFI